MAAKKPTEKVNLLVDYGIYWGAMLYKDIQCKRDYNNELQITSIGLKQMINQFVGFHFVKDYLDIQVQKGGTLKIDIRSKLFLDLSGYENNQHTLQPETFSNIIENLFEHTYFNAITDGNEYRCLPKAYVAHLQRLKTAPPIVTNEVVHYPYNYLIFNTSTSDYTGIYKSCSIWGGICVYVNQFGIDPDYQMLGNQFIKANGYRNQITARLDVGKNAGYKYVEQINWLSPQKTYFSNAADILDSYSDADKVKNVLESDWGRFLLGQSSDPKIGCVYYNPTNSIVTGYAPVTNNSTTQSNLDYDLPSDINVGDLVWVKKNMQLMKVSSISSGKLDTPLFYLENDPEAEKIAGKVGNEGGYTRDEIEPYVTLNNTISTRVNESPVSKAISLFMQNNKPALEQIGKDNPVLAKAMTDALALLVKKEALRLGTEISEELELGEMDLGDVDFSEMDLSDLDLDEISLEEKDLEELDLSDLDLDELESETEERPIWSTNEGDRMYVIEIPNVSQESFTDFESEISSLYGRSTPPNSIKIYDERTGSAGIVNLKIIVFETGNNNEYLPDVEQVFYAIFGRKLTKDDFRKPNEVGAANTNNTTPTTESSETPEDKKEYQKDQLKNAKIQNEGIRKTTFGWIGTTIISNYFGKDWKITTMKDYNGKIKASVTAGKQENNGTYSTFEYGQPSYTIYYVGKSRARATQQLISLLHNASVYKFKNIIDPLNPVDGVDKNLRYTTM